MAGLEDKYRRLPRNERPRHSVRSSELYTVFKHTKYRSFKIYFDYNLAMISSSHVKAFMLL